MSFEWEWVDVSNDVGMVRESRGGSFIELWLRHAGGNIPDPVRGEHPEAMHVLTPDGARAIADALIESARQIDGKAAGMSDLVAQLEQARAEIERLKGTPTDNTCTPRPPKPEWFGAPVDADGKPTGKWDAWWIKGFGVIRDVHVGTPGCQNDCCGDTTKALYGTDEGGDYKCIYFDDVELCIPVRREGPPAMDVDWAVVGG